MTKEKNDHNNQAAGNAERSHTISTEKKREIIEKLLKAAAKMKQKSSIPNHLDHLKQLTEELNQLNTTPKLVTPSKNQTGEPPKPFEWINGDPHVDTTEF